VAAAAMPLTVLKGEGECRLNKWTLLGEANWSPRDCLRIIPHRARWYMSNGWSTGGVLFRDLWVCPNLRDPLTWQQVNDATPYDYEAPVVDFQDSLVAVGDTQWRSTDGGANWVLIEETPFRDRWGIWGQPETQRPGELAVLGDKMVWIGATEVWVSDNAADINAWVRVIDNPAYGPRKWHEIATFGGRIAICGGVRPEVSNTPPEPAYPQHTTLTDVWSIGADYDLRLETSFAPWAPRYWHALATRAEWLYVIAGHSSVVVCTTDGALCNLNDVWRTRDMKNWYRYDVDEPNGLPRPRHKPACVVDHRDRILLLGGTRPAPSAEIFALE
jgi:hypothetical protein